MPLFIPGGLLYMKNFGFKKLTVDYHLDYSACIAYDNKENPLAMKYEMQLHFSKLKSKGNAEKYVNALTTLWTDLSGDVGRYKKNIVDAAMFYADHWTFKQQLCVYNCLLLLTFPFYRDVLKGIVKQCGQGGLCVSKSIEEFLTHNCNYKLSRATIKDYIAQVIATMIELKVIMRYTNGSFIKMNTPIYDDLGIYAVLKVIEALKSVGEDASWLLNCYNFEMPREFVDFFVDIEYSAVVGDDVWNEYNAEKYKSLQLNHGMWCCGSNEFVYDNGSRRTRRPRNSYVNIDDLKKAYGSEVFHGWSC